MSMKFCIIVYNYARTVEIGNIFVYFTHHLQVK